jgi:glutaredoxin
MDTKKLAYIGAGALLLWMILRPKTAKAATRPGLDRRSEDAIRELERGAGDSVILYTASWCEACKAAKEWLDSQGVAFVTKDIEVDADAWDEMKRKTKAAGVSDAGIPVIDVAGTILVGFDDLLLGQTLDQKGIRRGTGGATPPVQGRYTVQAGQGWSQMAKTLYDDYRWWPWLWDVNRTPTRYVTLDDSPGPGESIMAPVQPPADEDFKRKIFARASAYTTWWLSRKTKDGRVKPRSQWAPFPDSINTPTPLPTGMV